MIGGFYCENPGARSFDYSTNNTGTGKCQAGHYCVSGVSTPTPSNDTLIPGAVGGVCTTGHYCPEQTEVRIFIKSIIAMYRQADSLVTMPNYIMNWLFFKLKGKPLRIDIHLL